MFDAFADLWAAYSTTLGFGMVNAVFALACYATIAAGILSFAAVTFGAAGGFLGVQLVLHSALPLPLILLASGCAGLLVSLVVAAVFLRLESHWMALASLLLVLVTRTVVLSLPGITGGATGLTVPAPLPIGALALTLLLVMMAYRAMYHSWYGIAARVLRDDPAVARGMGIDVARTQFIAFAVSGFTGGLAGVLLALMLQFISPDTFFIHMAFTMIAGVVLGGSYHWFGPVVGAFAFTLLPTLLQAILPDIQDIADGVALLLIMVFLPRGLVDPRVVLMHLTVAQATRSRDPGQDRR
jgi:branched-chain amino acid transport system permease protein